MDDEAKCISWCQEKAGERKDNDEMSCCQGSYYTDSVPTPPVDRLFACGFSGYKRDAADFTIDGPKGQVSKAWLFDMEGFKTTTDPAGAKAEEEDLEELRMCPAGKKCPKEKMEEGDLDVTGEIINLADPAPAEKNGDCDPTLAKPCSGEQLCANMDTSIATDAKFIE